MPILIRLKVLVVKPTITFQPFDKLKALWWQGRKPLYCKDFDSVYLFGLSNSPNKR